MRVGKLGEQVFRDESVLALKLRRGFPQAATAGVTRVSGKHVGIIPPKPADSCALPGIMSRPALYKLCEKIH